MTEDAPEIRPHHTMEEIREVLSKALAILHPHDKRDVIDKTILLVIWKLAENAAITTHHQRTLEEQINALSQEIEQMDVTGFAPIVQKLNDAATSLQASAKAIGDGSTAAAQDQTQLNDALAGLATASEAVAVAAKAVADAVAPATPPAPPAPPAA